MINKLYTGIAAGLKSVKNCTVYQDDVPQNFSKPSFLISIYDFGSSKSLNRKVKSDISIDIMYFPENEQTDGAKEECWAIAQGMNRIFSIQDFKIKNRNMKIEDGVLHYMFDVQYKEYKEVADNTMQELIQKNGIKEE